MILKSDVNEGVRTRPSVARCLYLFVNNQHLSLRLRIIPMSYAVESELPSIPSSAAVTTRFKMHFYYNAWTTNNQLWFWDRRGAAPLLELPLPLIDFGSCLDLCLKVQGLLDFIRYRTLNLLDHDVKLWHCCAAAAWGLTLFRRSQFSELENPNLFSHVLDAYADGLVWIGLHDKIYRHVNVFREQFSA